MSKPERVLLVFGTLNRGGAETLAMNVFRNIDRDKIVFDFVVHTSEKCDYDDEIECLGGKIYRFPRYNVLNHFTYKNEWKNFLDAHKEYKIIHAHNTGAAAVYFPLAKKRGIFTIAHSHIAKSQSGIRQKVVDLYRLPLRYTADYLFACSQIAGEWMFGKNISKRDNYRVINNGVDCDKFAYNENYRDEIRKEFNIEGRFVVGNISRFHIQKNHSFLIDIFNELHKNDSNSVLLLVGAGDLKDEIQSKVKQLGLNDCVIFAGVRSDIEKILSAIDVFCMPSFREGLPVSLVEAQASSVHILGSDTISKEIKLTDLVEFCSLDDSPSVWSREILKYSQGYERMNTKKQLADCGYDIKSTAHYLQNFYLEHISND